MKKYKIGFVITSHYSDEIRPSGQKFLDRIIESIFNNVKYDFKIYIIDNESQYPLSYKNDDRIVYKRIDNQYEKGLTGAWNLGLNTAYEDGCDILLQCNDDLWFNETINVFIETIDSNDVVYCPLTNGVLPPSRQISNGPRDGTGVMECTSWGNVPNGFFFGFNRNHYKKFRYKEDEYFNQNHKYNEGDGKWGGQEGQFVESKERGLYGIIVNSCFVHHDKLSDWKLARHKNKLMSEGKS